MIKDSYIQQVGSLKTREGFEEQTKVLLASHAALQDQKEHDMINKKMKIIIAAAIAALLLTGTVFAAAVLLSPAELAVRIDNPELAKAFDSDEAIIVNESIQSGGYTITFLGMVNEGLAEIYPGAEEELTYAAFAITRDDGGEIEQMGGCPVSLTPLVDGFEPWCVNLFSLSSGANGFAEEGVYYFLFAVSNLELFADREVAIYAYTGMAPNAGIFAMDEATGAISYTEGYDGVRAVFELELDSTKADPAAAQALLEAAGFEFDTDGTLKLE